MDQGEHEPTVTQFHRSCLERNTNNAIKETSLARPTLLVSLLFICLLVIKSWARRSLLHTLCLDHRANKCFFSASSLLSYDIINKCCPVVANRALFDLDHLSL